MPGFSFSSVKAKNTMIVSIAIATIIFSVIISISVVDAFTNHIPSSPLTPSGSKITGGAADHAVPTSFLLIPLFAESENSRRSGSGNGGNGQRRRRKRPSNGSTSRDRGRGGARGGGGNANDYDYSGGNLKYGSGKYTQREHQGGVNLSSNGRSLQDQVYREDRQNVDRARGRPRGAEGGGNDFMGNDFGSRMDEIEDMERDLGMRGQGGRGRGGGQQRQLGGRFEEDFDDYEEDGPRRMSGGGLLRDMQRGGMGGGRDHREEYGGHGGMGMGGREEYGGHRNDNRGGDYGGAGGGGMMTNNNGRGANIMGGSSKGRGGGYAGSNQQSMNELSNERRRYEEATGGFSYMDRDEHRDERNDYIDVNNSNERGGGIGARGSSSTGGGGGGRGGASNFDRLMGRGGGGGARGGGRDDYEDDYEMMRGGRERGGDRRMNNGGGGRGGGGGRDYYEDDYDQRSDRGYNDQYGSGGGGGGGGGGRRGGGGGLLRDMMP